MVSKRPQDEFGGEIGVTYGSHDSKDVRFEGVARGHDMVAVSRRGTTVAGAVDVRGDATAPGVLSAALADGADAVVLAIGGARGTDRNRSTVTAAVLEALPSGWAGRVVVHSSLGAGDSKNYLPRAMQLFTSLVLRAALEDHTEQERLVRESGFAWTIVRPGGLTDKPASGHIAALEEPGPFAGVIARADVAAFILDCVEDAATTGRTFALGTPA